MPADTDLSDLVDVLANNFYRVRIRRDAYEALKVARSRGFAAALACDRTDATALATGRIEAERRRQIDDEGRTEAHDDGHDRGELAVAAAVYALQDVKGWGWTGEGPPPAWPWGEESWKPRDPIRNLVRAAALIVAEIERLERLVVPPPPRFRRSPAPSTSSARHGE